MSLFSEISTAITSAITTISSFLYKSAPIILKNLGELNPEAKKWINIISIVVSAIGTICDLLDPEEKIEDKGEQVLQATEAGITLEFCNNDFDEYQKRIDEFEIDPDKTHSLEECQIMGSAYILAGIKETFPYLRNIEPLLVLAMQDKTKDFFTPERVAEYVKQSQSMHINIDKIKEYYNDTLPIKDFDKVENLIYTAEKNLDSTLSKEKFNEMTVKITDEVKSL